MPRTAPGWSTSRISMAFTANGRGGAARGVSFWRGGRSSRRCARPTRSMNAANWGSAASTSPMRCASRHSRLFRRPFSSSQRRRARSPSVCSSASTSSQPWRSTVHSSRKACAMAAIASARDCPAGRSTSLSRCHSAVRRTCTASGSLPWVSAVSASSPMTWRSAALAACSPSACTASGKAPPSSASRQCARASSRCAVAPLLQTMAGSHNSRGSVASA
ncbi:MAG: hypothetical protein BWX79_02947 [Alphaproteobacteria bacterium ADurb.Bin100]|nr:MAG: hypothetical protein BWX79_02947 [Alphaproteobacteria bacterium ADurb.Bin100]